MNQKTKIIIWLVIVFLLSVGFWRYVDYILNVITPDSWRFDVEPAGILNLFFLLTVSALGIFLFNKKRLALAVGSAVGIGYLVIFGLNWLNFVGVGIALLMFLDSNRAINEDLKERVKLNSRTILRKGMPQIFIAVAVLASFAAYQSPVADSLAGMERLPNAGSQLIYKVAENVIESQVPKELPQGQRQEIIDEVANKTNSQFNTVFQAYNEYAPPALAFTLFLVALGASWIFVWISVGLGVLIFLILKALKVVKVEEYDAKAERLIV